MAAPMATPITAPPVLSSGVRVAVLVLTTIGVLGTWIDFFAIFWASGRGLAGGCGGMIGILLVLLLLVVILLLFIVLLAAGGLLLLWFRTAWGPPLVIAANLLAMGVYGFWRPISAGQIAWGFSLVALAALPALAVLLMLWPLLTRGRVWVKIVEFAALGLLAWPMLWLYVNGISMEVGTALQQPEPVVAASCSGGGA
jgi:hypothetical protein